MTDYKANTAYYKARCRCAQCRKQDAFTLNGRYYCAECAEKKRIREKRYREEDVEKHRAYYRKMTQKRKEAGLCPRCGRKPEGGYVTCARCRARGRAWQTKKRRENNASPYYWKSGICWTCKTRPVLDGKKLCRECYEQSLKNIAKAREAGSGKSAFSAIVFGRRTKLR